jgi:hypothetical protein
VACHRPICGRRPWSRFAEMYQGIAKDKTGFVIDRGIQKKGYTHSAMTPMAFRQVQGLSQGRFAHHNGSEFHSIGPDHPACGVVLVLPASAERIVVFACVQQSRGNRWAYF